MAKKTTLETKTQVSLSAKLSIGFMLATGLLTLGVFVFAGAYTLLINHFKTGPATNESINAQNDNINVNNSNSNSDLQFTTQ